MSARGAEENREPSVPREPLRRLFLRFLKFGLLAWGGPVAQIAMIRQEIVDEERWVSREHFNRILAVYQVLPGPEAHEMCVYFGMLSGGRLGGFLAGLAFMLPGFLLMLLLSWLYVGGVQSPVFKAFFLGIQPAVVALIVRAVYRIGAHAVTNRWLWVIAIVAGTAQFVGTSFWVVLPLAGLAYAFVHQARYVPALATVVVFLIGVAMFSSIHISSEGIAVDLAGGLPQTGPETSGSSKGPDDPSTQLPSLARLLVSGLRAGLLTFGGAYTVLPFLQHDAVVVGKWMTNAQFLDGVALSGILPAPFIIFSTFVGYLGGGPLGALTLTIGIFSPAFGFTLLGHRQLERLIANPTIHTFLDGVTAGVVGLIGATSIVLFRAGVRDAISLAIFGLSLFALYRWKAKASVAVVMLTAGALGVLLLR